MGIVKGVLSCSINVRSEAELSLLKNDLLCDVDKIFTLTFFSCNYVSYSVMSQ